jgi:signal transduction histidine kinase
VIILHSFGQDFRPWGEYARTIRAELTKRSRWPLEINDHPLAVRSSDINPELPFVEYLNALYAFQSPDLIVCIGAPAANFVQRHRGSLFPRVPMVLTAIEQRRVRADNLTENDTVVAVAHDFAAVFEDMLRVLPDTKTAVVINGASPNELFWLAELKRELKPFEDRIRLEWFEGIPFERILKEAASLPPHTTIFWHLMNIDAMGVAYEGDAGLKALYAVANAPIFSYDDGFFGQEVVGGPMYSVLEISQKTAAVAVRVLGGEKAGDIKTPASIFAPPRYDWRLLQRWQISEDALPTGSQVLFREASTWEKYRWQVLIVSAIVLTQALFIAGLLYQRRRLREAELIAVQRMSELAHVNRFSTAGQLTATIAHELNQPLGAILTNVETLEAMLKAPAPDMRELREIAADIRRDDQRAAEIIRRLRTLLAKAPHELRRLDLNAVVAETLGLLSSLAVSRKVQFEWVKGAVGLPVEGDAIQLQQVLLNLIVNAMDALSNGSASPEITVRTARIHAQAEVCISDNGPGIDPDKLDKVFEPFYSTKSTGMGMGLSIASTITEAHHGQLSAERPPEGGTLFRLRLPLA